MRLAPKEFEVLRVQLSRRGEVIPLDAFSVSIWVMRRSARNDVEAHVSRLRSKLADCGTDGVIATARVAGSMIC